MTRYVIKRVLLVLLTTFIVLSLTYILLACLKTEKVFLPSQGQIYAYYMDQVNRGFLIGIRDNQQVHMYTHHVFPACLIPGIPGCNRYLPNSTSPVYRLALRKIPMPTALVSAQILHDTAPLLFSTSSSQRCAPRG